MSTDTTVVEATTEDTQVPLEQMERQTDVLTVLIMVLRWAKENLTPHGRIMRTLHAEFEKKLKSEPNLTFASYAAKLAVDWQNQFETGKATIDKGVNFPKTKVEALFGAFTTANAWDLWNAIAGKTTSTGKMLKTFAPIVKDRDPSSVAKQFLN